MISRTRLLEVGSAALALATDRRLRLVGQFLLLGGLLFVLLRIRSIWDSSHLKLAQVEWSWIGGAVALALSVTVLSGLIWVWILRRLGVSASLSLAGVFLQAQLV
jgi:hypothetical protein